MPLARSQIQTLLGPLDPDRIRNRSQAGQTLSYLESWDVRRWLVRIFGHAGWSGMAEDAHLLHERPTKIGQRQADGFSVAYSCAYVLVIKDPGGTELARYREYAVSVNTGSDLAQCHDTALKSAESDALKRCAINLGDQFGLSLYDDGSAEPVIGRTLPADEAARYAKAHAQQQQQQQQRVVPQIDPPEQDHDELDDAIEALVDGDIEVEEVEDADA